MLRCFVVILFWLFSLCAFDVKITWSDGLKIELHGWLAWLRRKLKRNEM